MSRSSCSFQMQNQHWFGSTRVSSIPKIIKLVQANTNTNKPNTNNFSTIEIVYFVKMFNHIQLKYLLVLVLGYQNNDIQSALEVFLYY